MAFLFSGGPGTPPRIEGADGPEVEAATRTAERQYQHRAGSARPKPGPGAAQKAKPAPPTADPLKAARDLLRSLPRDMNADLMAAVLAGELRPDEARAMHYAAVEDENRRLRARIRAANGNDPNRDGQDGQDHDPSTSSGQARTTAVGARRAVPEQVQEQEHPPARLRADRTETRARQTRRLERQRPSGWRDASEWFIPRSTE